ncbi:MAG: sel1 repeat family protein [Verrucomicrobia bacterium]|nr:sel1 repeat family protein [Verrucomicrobiota bacterium]MBI3870316.1 sel1 repeat family protein [Verrucomicrobiota bacterium]
MNTKTSSGSGNALRGGVSSWGRRVGSWICLGIWAIPWQGGLSSARGSASPGGDRNPPLSANARVPSDSDKDGSEFFQQARFAESTKDFAEAFRLYRRGASRGHAPCQNNLGFMLLRGLGVKRDPQEAVLYFRDAAKQSYPAAQNNLGICYRDGLGVKEDLSVAAKWFLQAAEQGFADAQNNLGVRFYRGSGMPRNTEEAMKWFTKAADQGLGSAWVNLGICYAEGRGAPKDLGKAFEYFSQAAGKGDADGLLYLGFAHMEGRGVPKDLVRAYVCFNTAMSFGDSYASQARTKLKREMTEKQIAEAQRRSYEYSSKDHGSGKSRSADE